MNYCERKDAIAAEQPTYFTGRACTNGHVAYRYTSSGSCSECMAAARGQITAPKQGIMAQRREFKARTMAAKVRIYPADLLVVREAVGQLNVARWPDIDRLTLETHKDGKGNSSVLLYEFRLHPDDYPMLDSIAAALRKLRGPTKEQIDAIRGAWVTKAAEQDAPPDTVSIR